MIRLPPNSSLGKSRTECLITVSRLFCHIHFPEPWTLSGDSYYQVIVKIDLHIIIISIDISTLFPVHRLKIRKVSLGAPTEIIYDVPRIGGPVKTLCVRSTDCTIYTYPEPTDMKR